ncbi:MAG: hypothetical protein IKU07_00250 [Oscillospiraceae bacterium]|nr:hypothetical protein [Oscillospiraceae bacterium]
MKQETGKKKSKLWLWLVIAAVALLAVAGVVVALVLGGGEGETGPQGGRAELYWNIDRKTYTENSESGLSTREPGEDGVFKVRFAYNGEIVEYAVADKQLINYIDTMDAMGLVKDSDGTVVDVINPKDIAKEVNKNAYVKSATATKIVANTSVAMNGMNINVKLEEGITEIYDVTPQAEVPGQKITTDDLKAMDTLVIYANDLDQVTHVYVNSHSKESKVYWRADQFYDSTNKTTTREPDENGAYTIPFFCEGEVVELKTKDKAIATKIDSISRWKCHFGFTFDEEGYIIEQYASAIGIQGIMVADCWDVVEIDGDTYTIQRLTTNDGSVWTGTIPEGTIIYEAGVKAKREGRGGQQIDSLQMGDRVTVWTNTTGEVVLVYVAERLVDSPAYWSPTRKYNSTKKETTREIGASGYYEIELYKEGSDKKEIYYVKDKETMSYMDSITAKIMGLKVLPGNIVEYAYDEQTLTGYTTATRGGVVTAVTGGIFTKMTYGKRGTESNMVLAANARVWNVSQYGKYGEATTVQPGDHVYAVRQPTGEILLAFITKRTAGGEHLYWNTEILWDKTNKTSTREPDADGWYHFTMAHQGKLVELKTKDKKLVDKIDGLSIGATGLDVSGGVITAVYDAGYPYGGNKVASGYRFQYVTAEGKYFCTYASDANKTVEFVMAEDCVIYNVSAVYDSHQGERIYSIPKNAMLTCFCDIYGEVKVVYVRSQAVKDMYWKTEILYDSTNKVTKRVPDADGYYWYTLAVNGECKTFKTKLQKVANSMDSYAGAFGLNVKGDEIVGFVSTSSVLGVSGNGYTTASVIAINGRTITVEASGKTETMKLSSDCKIYDVSPVASSFGMKSEIKVGDIVRTYLNTDKTEHCYVYIKARASRVKGEVGYCEHCKKEVKWKPMDGNSSISASHDHWYVPADITAWVQTTFANKTKDTSVCLDLNGKTLTRAEGGRMFRVAEGDTLNIMDSVGGGKVVSYGGTGYNGGLMMMSAGGVVNMYGGTLEYVDGKYEAGLGGNVYVSGSKTVFNLYGGTVTGGASYADQNTDPGAGGNFYLVGGATLNMYGGEVSNGRAYGILRATEKNGTVTYKAVEAYGGNIYMTESSMVNILGGVVKDGHAVRETFTYTDNGVEKSLTNMSYGGNIYKVNTAKLNGTLYIENATVSGGKAHRGGNINAYAGAGGGSAGIVVLNKANIVDGVASQFGGNIMSNAAIWSVTDSVISGGESVTGGNIYSQGGIYSVEGSTISNGKADNGGNIYLYKNKVEENVFAIGAGTVVENGVATGNGGNINVAKKNYVQLSDGTVVAPADDDGTGVALLPILGIIDGEVKGGQAATGANIYLAGHFYMEGGSVTDGDVYFDGANEAAIELCGGEIADQFTVKKALAVDVYDAPKVANLNLDKDVLLTVGEMTEGADIKVTTHYDSEKATVFTESNENLADYIAAGYISSYNGKTIEITADNKLAVEGEIPGAKTIYCNHCQQEVVFAEWSYGSGSYTKESGHFYLKADESISANHRIGGSSSDKAADGVDVVLDLNGYKITSTSGAFYVYPYSTLTIQDSVGTSVITGEGVIRKDAPGDGGVFYVEKGNLNIYGGTFTLADTTKTRNGGVIFGGGNIKIYGGTFNGNDCITGAGSAIHTSGNLELNGGTIKGDVFAKADATVTLSGAPVVENLQIQVGDLVTLGELTEGADITVEAEGVFTKPSVNAQAYVDDGYIKSATATEVTVTANNELAIGEVVIEGLLNYYCPICEKNVDWLPYDGVSAGIIKGNDAHFYIAETEHYQSYGQISIQGEVTLDLHGNTLLGKGRNGDDCKRLWRFEGVFNLIDTVGGGKAVAYGLAGGGGAMAMCYGSEKIEFNMYGGTLMMTEDCQTGSSGGMLSLSGKAVMNMYGGEIKGGKATREHAQNIYIGEATLNMMGGFIDGGIEVSTSAVAVNLSGAAKISNTNGGLWIAKDKLIGLDAFETGAEVYVSVDETAFITGALNNANDFLAYVKPALTGWTVENRNGALIVTDGNEPAEPFDPNKVAEKAAAMDFSGADAEGKVVAKCPVCEEEVEWNVLPANTSGSSMATVESGHYYLSADVDYTQNNGLYSFVSKQICLNLNGQDMVSTKRVFYTEKNDTVLNIMGQGTVTSPGEVSGTTIRGGLDMTSNTNLYGGTYISTVADHPAVENRKSSSGEATISVYAGTTITNAEGGIAVNLKSKGALAIYGGTINGKVVDAGTTGITVSGAPVINALDLTNGAKITVGELTNGANITVLANAVFTNDFANAKAYLEAGYFVSGDDEYKLVAVDNTLSAAVAMDPDAVYEAAKAMDFTAGGTVTAQCPACGVDHDWVALPAPSGSSANQLAAGAYYVAEDLEVTKFWYIADKTAGKVCINLNGKNITSATDRLFYAENKSNTLNIMGDGVLTGLAKWPNSANTNYIGVLDACTTVNLYGGTWRSGSQYPIIANRGSGAHSIVSIYGGTEIIRTAEDVAGLNVYISDGATVNMYGGIISGGTAIEHPTLGVGTVGGNVQLKASVADKNYAYSCTFNLYGGIVENGTSVGKGGNIAAVGNDLTNPKALVNLYGGTVANGGVIAIGANAAVTVSGDAVVDYIETEGANLINVGELEDGADIVVAAQESVVFTNAVTGDVAKYFRGNTNRMAGYTLNDAVAIANICPHCGKTFAEIEWTEIGEIGENNKFTASGHYKLTQDVTNTKSNIFTFDEATKGNGIDVVLDTCGFNVTSVGRGIYLNKYNTMTVFDSVGGTEITSISKTEALGGSGIYVHTGAVLNFYDATVIGSPDAHGNGNVISVYGDSAVVNIYSGAFYGHDDTGKSGKTGGVVYNRAGTLNIYGGYFNAAELAADGKGDCIYNNKNLNIYGGEFAGEIYTESGATTNVADDLDITDLLVNG